MKHFLVAIIFMLMSSAMKIYASDMRFYNADNTYGITIREPSSICKDDDGFMWVATKSGIYRLSDESKCYNVPYTTVNIVSVELVHRKGELYVFTNHGEIFRYNKRLDRFEHYLNLLSALNTEAIYLADIKIGGAKDILWLLGRALSLRQRQVHQDSRRGRSCGQHDDGRLQAPYSRKHGRSLPH